MALGPWTCSVMKQRKSRHTMTVTDVSSKLSVTAAQRTYITSRHTTRSRITDGSISRSTSVKSILAKFENFEADLEKRHFPGVHNQKGALPTYKPSGRKFIAHGLSEEQKWIPHSHYQEPDYREIGPDWKSKIRRIPSPRSKNYPAEQVWPKPWRSIRTYPSRHGRTCREFSVLPNIPASGCKKKCVFDGHHMATIQSTNEITDAMRLGKKREITNPRCGLTKSSPGDKSYQAAEYSPGFHKVGSTRPVVNFGGEFTDKPDTFVPLQDLPSVPRESFMVKERRRIYENEIQAVTSLNAWRPATPLGLTIYKESRE